MSIQIKQTNQRLLQREFWRISELASTAERHSRIYKTKDGKTRIIKARPAKKGILPMGESTIWEKVRLGEFPQSIKISPRITCWRKSDIIEWLESKQ